MSQNSLAVSSGRSTDIWFHRRPRWRGQWHESSTEEGVLVRFADFEGVHRVIGRGTVRRDADGTWRFQSPNPMRHGRGLSTQQDAVKACEAES